MRNSDLKKKIINNQLTIGTWVTIPSIIMPDIYLEYKKFVKV